MKNFKLEKTERQFTLCITNREEEELALEDVEVPACEVWQTNAFWHLVERFCYSSLWRKAKSFQKSDSWLMPTTTGQPKQYRVVSLPLHPKQEDIQDCAQDAMLKAW